MDFIVVDAYSPYKVILAIPQLHAMGVVSFTLDMKVKYPMEGHVGELLGCQMMARQCMVAIIRHQMLQISHPDPNPSSLQSTTDEARALDEASGANVQCEELEKVVFEIDEEKYFQVGTQLPLAKIAQLLAFLRSNLDEFAWSTYEAPGVDLNFICHYLNLNTVVVPRKPQPRWSSKEHTNANEGRGK